MAKKTFYIPTRLVFVGSVEAFDEDIVDWDFGTHGDTVINRKQEEGEL